MSLISPTDVLRPNAEGLGVADFTKVGAAATKVAGLADDVASTGIIKSNSKAGTVSCSFIFPNSVILTPDQKVRAVRVKFKATSPLTSGKFDAQLGTQVSGAIFYSTPLALRGQYTSETLFTGGWYIYSPDGQVWNQARLDGLRIQFTEYGENTGTVSAVTCTEAYIDVDVATRSTVATPTISSLSASSYPTISWTITDSNLETQQYYQVKVFTSAQYSAGGFDPETSTAYSNSGEVASSDLSAVPDELLINGTYKAYVKSGKLIAGSVFYSAWTASSAFVMAVVSPNLPTATTISASVGSNHYATISVTGNSYASGTQTYQVQRSVDGGATWSTVRNATALAPNVSFIASVNDYELPRDVAVYYRSRSIGVIGENSFTTAWTQSSSVTLVNDQTWWMIPVDFPTYGAGSLRVNNGISEKIEETLGVFRPLGRTTPLVVAGSLYGEDGNYSVITTTDAEWNTFVLILNAQCKILVQDPYGVQKYVRFVSRSLDLAGTSNRRLRQVKIDYVEVEST